MISVAMIGRNEAGTINTTLESVRPYASEIIYVDTGSTDATPQIAAAYGAHVKHVDWTDDFSSARNAALKYCACPWVLSVDCDEVLRPGAQTNQFFKDLQNNDSTLGYTVTITNRLPDGSQESHSAIRLFRNRPEISYRNPIHESVSESIYELSPNESLGAADFSIIHNGYASLAKNQKKLERNLRILRQWINVNPEDPFAWFKLGLTLRVISADESMACLFRSFELLLSRNDRNSFAFRFELLQVLVDSLKGGNQAIYNFVKSEGERVFV